MPKTTHKMTKLPGTGTVWLDMSTVVCVRAETGEHGTVAIVHTTEGFAIGAVPTETQSVVDLVDAILALC